jgi:predicted nucleic acid-binding protein
MLMRRRSIQPLPLTVSTYSFVYVLSTPNYQLYVCEATFINNASEIFGFCGVIEKVHVRTRAHVRSSEAERRARDALHLSVALETGVEEFATLDRLLAEKAKEAGLPLTNL